MQNIDGRLRAVIDLKFETSRRFKHLQDETGIDANRWKAVWHGRQRVMPDMIETIGKAFPQYAFWMITGISDPQHGHVAPGDYGFPRHGEEQPSSNRYFREALAARAAAQAAMTKWMDADFDDPEQTLLIASDDQFLRGAHLIEPAETPELSDSLRRVHFAAKLRQAEIAVHGNMPDLDHDETEAALKPIKRLLTESMQSYEKLQMVAEMEGIQRKIACLDEIVMRHRGVTKP
jgi:uncharacterized protein YoaH (UPF0181 family)